MSVTRYRIAREKLKEKLAKCVQFLILLAAETGRVDVYDLLEEIEGKPTSYEVMMARAKPFLDAKQKAYNEALTRVMQTKKKENESEEI